MRADTPDRSPREVLISSVKGLRVIFRMRKALDFTKIHYQRFQLEGKILNIKILWKWDTTENLDSIDPRKFSHTKTFYLWQGFTNKNMGLPNKPSMMIDQRFLNITNLFNLDDGIPLKVRSSLTDSKLKSHPALRDMKDDCSWCSQSDKLWFEFMPRGKAKLAPATWNSNTE